MKRIRFIALAAALLILLSGCPAAEPAEEAPLNFYYLREQIQYLEPEGVICAEVREGCELKSLEATLRLYLQGPITDTLRSPLPKSVTLVSIQAQPDHLTVEFSSRLAYLTGMELTLACACIAKTCLELTDLPEIRICAQDTLLDGAKYIPFTADSLLLFNESPM